MKIAILLIAILLQASFAAYTPITDQPNCLADNLTADGKCTMTKATRAVNGTNTSTVGLRVYKSKDVGAAQEADVTFSGTAQTYNYYSLENTNESGQAPQDSCGNSEPMVRNCNVYDNYGICVQCICGYGLLMNDEGVWTCIENEQRTPYCHKYNSNLDCIECKWTIDNPNFANIKSSDFSGALDYDYGLVNPNNIPGQNFCVNNVVVSGGSYDEQLNRVYLTTGTNNQEGITPKCKYYTATKNGDKLVFKCNTCHTRQFDLEGNNRFYTTETPSSSTFPWISSDYILSYVKGATIEYTCKHHPINFVTKPSSLQTVALLTGWNIDTTNSACTSTEDNETDNRPIEDCGLSDCSSSTRTKYYGCAEKKDCQPYTTFEWDYDTFQSTRTWWRKIKDGSCIKPGNHCTKLSGGQCITCDSGFYPVEGKSECMTITSRNTAINANCKQGYYLYNTSTSSPKPDSYKCQICNDGYYRLHLQSDLANTGTNDFKQGSIVCKQKTKNIDFDDYTGYLNTFTKINTQGCMERIYKKDSSNNESYNCYTQEQNLFFSGFNSTDTGSCRDGNLMNQSRRLCKVGKEQLVNQMIPNCDTYSVYQYDKQKYRCYQCDSNCWLNTVNSKCYCPLKTEKIKNCDLYYQGQCMKCKVMDTTKNPSNYYLVYSDKCISYDTDAATLKKYANCLRISQVTFPDCANSGITPGQCVECEIGFILDTSSTSTQFCKKDTSRYAQYAGLNKQELVSGTDTYTQYIDQSSGLLKCDKLVGDRTPSYYFDLENHQPYKKQYCIRTPTTDNCLQYRTDATESDTSPGYGTTQYQSAFLTTYNAKVERCILCKDGYYLSADGQSCDKPTVSVGYVGKNQYGERVAVKTKIDGCITYSDQGDYCLRCEQNSAGTQMYVKLNGSSTQCIVKSDTSCDSTNKLYLQFADWRYYVSSTSYPYSEYGQLCMATADLDANCKSHIYSLYRTSSNNLALRCADCNNIANTSSTLKNTYYITADSSFDTDATIKNKCILTFDPAREGDKMALNLNYQGLPLQTYSQFVANNLERLLYAQQLVQKSTDSIPEFYVQDATNKKDHYWDYWNLQQSQCIVSRISTTTGTTRNTLSYYSKSYQSSENDDHLMNKGCAVADNQDNGLGCKKCSASYIMSKSGLCILKSPATAITGCAWQQQKTSTTNICVKCKDGYVFDSNNDCVATNCTTVKPNSYNKCNVCNDGYYKDGTSETCKACQNNCKTCSSDTTCITCDTGYSFKSSDNTCIQCNPANCTECSTTANTCTTCKDGYYVSTGTCSSCNAACATCNGSDATNCVTCKDTTYFLDGNTCTQCDANCTNCTSATVCGTCKDGYSYISNTCTSCTKSNCKQCTTAAATCTTCNSGYFVDAGGCTACTGCDACSDATTCTSCLKGKFLDGSSCTACDGKCTACSTSATNCSECATGNYLSGSTCTACTTGCATCTAADTCQTCSATYKLVGNSCIKCSNNCDTCTSSTNCTKCSATYYLKNNACTQDCGDGFLPNIDGTCSATTTITYSPTTTQCYKTPSITNCIDYDVTNKTCKQCAAGYLLKTKETRDATTGDSTFTYTCVFSADFNFIQSKQAITTYCIYQTFVGTITSTSTSQCARYHLPDIAANDATDTVTYNEDIAAYGKATSTVQCVYPFYLSGSTCVLNDDDCLIHGSSCTDTFTFSPSEYLCSTYRTNKHSYSNTLQTLSCKTPKSATGSYFQVIKQTEYTAGEGDTQVTYIGDGPFQGCTRFKRTIGKKDANNNVIFYNWDCCGCDNKRHYISENDNKLEYCSIGTQYNCGVYESNKDSCKNCCKTNSIIFELDSGVCQNYCNIATNDSTKIYAYQDQEHDKGDPCTVTGCINYYYFDTEAKTCTIKDTFLYNGQQTIIGCNYQNTNYDQTYFQNKNACVKRDQKCDCYDNQENSLDLYYTNKAGTNYCRRPYNYAAEEDQCLRCNVGYKYENGACTKRDTNNHCAFWGENGQCEVCDFVQIDSNQIPDRQNEYRLTQDGTCVRNKEPNDLFKGCRKSSINGDVEVCIQCYNYDVTYPYKDVLNVIEPSTLDSRGHSRKFCMFKEDNTYLSTRAYSTGATNFGFDPQWCMVGYQTYNKFSTTNIMTNRFCSICFTTTNNMKDTYYYSNINKEKVYTAYNDASQITNNYEFKHNGTPIDDKRIYYDINSQCAVESLGGTNYNVKYCRRYSRTDATVCTECHPGYHSDYVRYPGLDNNLSNTASGTKCIPDDYNCAQTGCRNYKNLRKFEFNKCDVCYQTVNTVNKDGTTSPSLYSINSYSFVCDNIGGGVIEEDTPKLYSFTGKDGGVLTFYDPGDDGDNDFKEKFVDDLTVFGSQLYFSMALLCILALFVLV